MDKTAQPLRRRMACIFVALTLAGGLFPAAAHARTPDPTTDCSTIVGTYGFSSNERTDIVRTNTFAYNDEWFMGDAADFNQHLATLSALTSNASASVYSAEDERDNSRNSENIEDLLNKLGFSDVTTNTYYNQEKLVHSTGVAIGHKTITDNGKDYTLIALVPRSAAYKQEWAGNFIVGKTGLSEGFKAGRDEILRFMKSYVEEKGIAGDVKLWTCGHSRGAALANMIGGFFAAGGADGYIDGINLQRDNIYAYTFATPTTVVAEGTTKSQVLDVAGAQSYADARYADDTPGAAYTYAGADAGAIIDPHGSDFACIHNAIPDYDIVTLVPPQSWGFTHFGTSFPLTDGADATKQQMLQELVSMDPEAQFAYQAYVNGGDESDYRWMTFDLDSLDFVPDEGAGDVTMAQVIAQRLTGLLYHGQTREAYVDGGYQDVFAAVAAAYGMNEPIVRHNPMSLISEDITPTIKAALFSYLAYASDRLQTEARAASDEEAAAIVLAGLLELATGDTVDPASLSIDETLRIFSSWLADRSVVILNEDDAPVDASFTTRGAEALGGALAKLLIGTPLGGEDEATSRGMLAFLVKQFAYGSGTKEAPDIEEAESSRSVIYVLLPYAELPEEYAGIIDAIDRDGANHLSVLLGAAMPVLAPEGATTLAQAADESLKPVLDYALQVMLDSGRYDPGTSFYDDLVGYGSTLQEKVTQLRTALTYALFFTEGEPFSTAATVRTAATFVSQARKIPPAHYNELYVAWMRAQDSAYPAQLHQLVHTDALDATCTEDGHSEYWQCSVCGLYFADENAQTEIELASTVIEAHGHDWGAWKVIKEPTKTAEGTEERVCTHDSSHTETRPIPKLDPDSYTITFDLAGGTLDGDAGPIRATYEEGTQITILDAPKRAGYSFQYWEGSRYAPGDSYTVIEDHTFTAVWKETTSPSSDDPESGDSSSKAPVAGKTPVASSAAASKPAPTADPIQPVHVALLALTALASLLAADRARREN